MSTFPVRATYATPVLFKSYMNSVSAPAWTADDASLLTLMESVSRAIDAYLGNQSVHPRVEQHNYDLASGGLRNDRLVYTRQRFLPSWDRGLLETATAIGGQIALGDWLLTLTQAAIYTDTNESAVLYYQQAVPGSPAYIANPANYQIFLDPEDEQQKRYLSLNELASAFFYGGQRTVQIQGTWGWQNLTHPLDTLGAAVTTTTQSTIQATTNGALVAGMTILIDSEQLYVWQTPSSNAAVPVLRGVNGTAAATHLNGAAISVYEEPAEIVEACLDIARCRWRARQMGNTLQIADPQQGISIPSPASEEKSILRRLDRPFRAHAFSLGAF